MPAADLEKALDASIWPLRVKVREYIHYSNKPRESRQPARRQQFNQSSSAVTQGQGQQQGQGQVPSPLHLTVPTFNRYDPLGALSMPVNQL